MNTNQFIEMINSDSFQLGLRLGASLAESTTGTGTHGVRRNRGPNKKKTTTTVVLRGTQGVRRGPGRPRKNVAA